MKTIYKYPLYTLPFEQEIEMNAGARILKVEMDPNGVPCIWALVDTDAPKHLFKVIAASTGWALDEVLYPVGCGPKTAMPAYIDSIVDGDYVWHIFVYDKTYLEEWKRSREWDK